MQAPWGAAIAAVLHMRHTDDEELAASKSMCQCPVWRSAKQHQGGVVFEKQRSAMCDFRLNGAVVERVDRYKYLGFVFHATKGLHFGTEALMAVARKTLFAMW